MGNVTSANFDPNYMMYFLVGAVANGAARLLLWKLSRTMKAAGWVYKCSGSGDINSGQGKDGPSSTNPENDKWNGYGTVISGQTGRAALISANPTTNVYTVSGLTGMSSSSVGRILVLSGCTSVYWNGPFRIVAYNSATSVNVYNSYNGSQPEVSNGKIIWTEYEKLAYVPNQSGSLASITTKSGNVMTITGLTGMIPLSTNRYLSISGASSAGNNGVFKIIRWISKTSVAIINSSGVASDANNGSISWKESDPLLEQYPHLMHNSWICMQGPSTIKIPITAESTGTFLKGENIKQPGSGAEGEIIGYQWDSGGTGFLVVMPRVDGYGAGRLGWDTNPIIGDLSSATITPSATPIEFVREVVLYNNTQVYYISSWIQCVDAVSENTSRFSVLAASAGCTSAVAPGAGGTGNTFPTIGSYVTHGNGTSTGYSFYATTNILNNCGLSQSMCADATYDINRSADGSFASTIYIPNIVQLNPQGKNLGFVYTRCDNQEEGDVDPYIWFQPVNYATAYTGVAYNIADSTSGAGNGSNSSADTFSSAFNSMSNSVASVYFDKHLAKGWRRRGFSTNDVYQNFMIAFVCTVTGTSSTVGFNGKSHAAIGTWGSQNDGFGSSYDSCIINTRNYNDNNFTYFGEPIWVVSSQNTKKMRKGTCRWIRAVSTNNHLYLFNGGSFIQMTSSFPAFIIGPWDGFSFALKG